MGSHGFCTFVVLLSFITMAAVDASVAEAKKEEWQRLPDSVKPIHYDVRLVPDMRHPDEGGTCKFEGEVAIELDVKQPDVKTISFNALDMTLLSATVEQNGVKQVATTALKEADEIGECTVPAALAVGKAVLTIKYTGELNDKMKGFYRSVYQDEAGKNKMLATTQFEATDARRALPCWDEPAVKATFGVTLVVPDSKDMVAVSNMPEVSSSVADGKRTVTFDKTPVMSSYLLAFVIGDFEYLEGKDANDIIIRCYTLKGKKAQGQFALDVALKTLPHYTKYFEIGYPLPKLDMFAIPDFSAGAMENWGLVTYRETALLVDEHKTSAASKEWVALVVAHELAHQWFGNLVTMEWWSHLWLNEGFATFVEFLSVDFIFPSWNIWELFVSDSLGRSLELDGLESSHPVEVEVRHPSEIDEIFDIISYSKGSCLNRMLSTFLGDEQFRQGLVKYLNKYKYANAETGDLWDVLEEHTGKPVRKVMSAWTSQTGYPVLIVTASGDAEVKLDIKQRRFLESGIPEDGKENSLWPVPVLAAVAVADQKELKAVESLASEAQSAMSLGVAADKIDWIKINYGQSGHYRVQYDATMLDKIIKALESGDERLSVVDRLGIQNDAFALTSAKLFDVQQLFRLIRSFRKEKNYTVWKDLTQNLSKLGGLLRATDMWPAFCRFMLELFSEVAKVVGWDKKPNEDHHTSMLRSVVINALRTYDDEEAHAEALKRFESLQAAEAEQRLTGVSDDAALAEVLIPDLRSAVYCMVVSKGGKLGYDKIYDIFRTATHPEEKVRALRALAAAPSDDLIRRTWDLALSDEVRLQNRFIPLQSLLLNRNGIHVCMELLTRDWDKLLATLGESFQLGRVIKALNSFPSAERVKQVEEFFKERQAPRAKRAIEQTLEGLKAEAAWLAHDEKGIRAFLDAHYGAPEHTEL